ncbi:MAG: 50S ribosomal protein L30 [Dehalococcoidia bacterium]|nr:50S ribosomal protein L30 [Dehalococcoidia bacterium]
MLPRQQFLRWPTLGTLKRASGGEKEWQKLRRIRQVAKIRIKWIKSDIGYAGDQRRTIKALGFHRLNEVVEKEDTPVIRGMIAKVSHMIFVEENEHGSK